MNCPWRGFAAVRDTPPRRRTRRGNPQEPPHRKSEQGRLGNSQAPLRSGCVQAFTRVANRSRYSGQPSSPSDAFAQAFPALAVTL